MPNDLNDEQNLIFKFNILNDAWLKDDKKVKAKKVRNDSTLLKI
jgi:hypothetical protein